MSPFDDAILERALRDRRQANEDLARLRTIIREATVIFADSEGHSVTYIGGEWECEPDCPAHDWLAKARAELEVRP